MGFGILKQPQDRPLATLFVLFTAWKLLLLLVALGSPGPGYDTSTILSFVIGKESRTYSSAFSHVSEKLTRWDGIYFVTVASRGYLHEQEWAFGYGFTRLASLVTAGLLKVGITPYNDLEALVAIFIAHLAHLCSVIVLFKLTLTIFGPYSTRIALTTALLHILSPAGIFLSAPYAESACAFLTFAGCLNFAKSFARDGRESILQDALIVISGVIFGAATTFRSNGIFNGLLHLEEAIRLTGLLCRQPSLRTARRLIATGVGGMFVGAGFILPQFVAYREYCGELMERRPWCDKMIPSIYTFVQDHYWAVGLFKYWTISNLPLFLLGAPMYLVMMVSSVRAFQSQLYFGTSSTGKESTPDDPKGLARVRIYRTLALAQLLLVTFTFTTAHVQIITRISSAYPVWMWSVASSAPKPGSWTGALVQFMVMYALIQGTLFASFLPPA